MNKQSNRFMKWGVVALIAVLGIAAWFITANGKNTSVSVETNESSAKASDSVQTLPDFCADETLNAWFSNIEENPPVKMDYTLFGEDQFSLEVSDRELILKTVEALKTVTIGGPSETTPEEILDGDGHIYIFLMEDGTKRAFSIEQRCFRWNRDEWHDVVSYGDLAEVNDELADIGILENVSVYADDGGFYTEALETYKTEWKEEDGIGGGLFIYTSGNENIPYIEICRCETTESSPEAFLKGELDSYMRSEIEESAGNLLEVSEIEDFSVGRSSYPSVVYTAALPEEQGGGKICYLNVILEEEDDSTGEPCLVRMCAVYRERDNTNSNAPNSEKNRTAGELKVAISHFNFKHKAA